MMTPEERKTRLREQKKAWYQKNKEHQKAQTRAWAKKNPERRREQHRRWREKHKESLSLRVRERTFGLSPEAQFALLESQGNGCAICKVTLALGIDKKAHLDHDHATGKVRGWLCGTCNQGLGMMKDSPALLRAAAEYLERSKR